MSLLGSSRHLGGLRAVELTCFRRLGERAPRLVPASCARWAASASLARAWRASLLEVLLPVSVGLPGLEELTILPEGTLGDELARALPELDQALAERGRVRGPRDRDSRADDGLSLIADLSGRLYPLILADCARRLEVRSPAADGAVVRAVGRAMADLEVVQAERAALCGRPG